MSSCKVHCEDCVKLLGQPFEHVHEWLDELAANWAGSTAHRDERHNKIGIEEIRKEWGDDAAKAAVIHILRDWGNLIKEDEIPKDFAEAKELRMQFWTFVAKLKE